MDRAEKEALVKELRAQFEASTSVVVARQKGMTVAKTQNLRGKIREKDCSFRVAKNRLVRIAIEGTPFESLSPILEGPTTLAFSTDPSSAAKIMVDYCKSSDNLEIIGGAMEGELFDADGVVNVLSKMPTLDEIRAKLAGLLKAPAAKMAGVLKAPAQKVVGVIKAYEDKLAENA
jgi:large subunit ribosomal protein L10